MDAGGIEQDGYAGVTEIPPVIYCARCGLPSCEGCAPPALLTLPRTAKLLSWAAEGPSLRRLLDGALQSSTDANVVFAELRGTAPARALAFALAVELLALGSILVTAVLALLAALPHFTAAFLRSGSTWFAFCLLWLLSSVLVVLLHVFWAALLERGVIRNGAPRAPGLALAFACYSCGWDLLTSPVGIWLSIRRAAASGEGRGAALLSALRAPRPAMMAYLEGCRGLERGAAVRVVRRAARDALLIVCFTGLLCIGIILGLLAAALPY